jgi:hypothetical protein
VVLAGNQALADRARRSKGVQIHHRPFNFA